MIKPSFAEIVIFTPAAIRAVRTALRLTQDKFGRLFPVSADTIRSWESGRRNPYGPSSTLLQQFKEYTDHVKEERSKAVKSYLRV